MSFHCTLVTSVLAVCKCRALDQTEAKPPVSCGSGSVTASRSHKHPDLSQPTGTADLFSTTSTVRAVFWQSWKSLWSVAVCCSEQSLLWSVLYLTLDVCEHVPPRSSTSWATRWSVSWAVTMCHWGASAVTGGEGPPASTQLQRELGLHVFIWQHLQSFMTAWQPCDTWRMWEIIMWLNWASVKPQRKCQSADLLL